MSGARGFTLVELLIALAIFATMALLGYRAVDALVGSESQLAAEGERWRELDGFFARLEGDIRAAVPREVRFGATTEPAWSGAPDARGNAELSFSRATNELAADAGGPGQRIGYRLREGSVQVLYWSRFDRAADARPAAYTLAANISAFRIDYLDGRGTWRERWPSFGEPPLPRALRVQLALADGLLVERTLVIR